MSGIKKILDVEDAARKLLADAHATAKESLAAAKKSATDDTEAFVSALESDRTAKAEAQKKDLAELYSSIIAKSKKSIDKLESEAGGRHAKAVTQVMHSLTQ